MVFPISNVLDKAVLRAFPTINQPTNIQSLSIKEILENNTSNDVIIKSATGTGKSLAFILPILDKLLGEAPLARSSSFTPCIIIAPTRELAHQTLKMIKDILDKLLGSNHWIVAGQLTGGEKKKTEKSNLRKGLHIVVGTPGRLLDHLKTTLSWSGGVKDTIKWLVLDEVDRLKDLGFEKTISEIMSILTEKKRMQIIMVSATASSETTTFGSIQLNMPKFISTTASTITKDRKEEELLLLLKQQVVIPPTKLRTNVLFGMLDQMKEEKIVVFLMCCDSVDFFFAYFEKQKKHNQKLFKLHGSLEQSIRTETIKSFLKETNKCVLFCTDVAARGLNLIKVTTIIQFDAPCDTNDYVHRAGRTARQQEVGRNILVLMPSERPYIDRLKSIGMAEIEEISWKLFYKDKEEKIHLFNKTDKLYELGKNGFIGMIRGYATHPKVEKDIFHLKQLHLGHLCATFGLSEPPTEVSSTTKSRDMPNKKRGRSITITTSTTNNNKRSLSNQNDSNQDNTNNNKEPRLADHTTTVTKKHALSDERNQPLRSSLSSSTTKKVLSLNQLSRKQQSRNSEFSSGL